MRVDLSHGTYLSIGSLQLGQCGAHALYYGHMDFRHVLCHIDRQLKDRAVPAETLRHVLMKPSQTNEMMARMQGAHTAFLG